MSVTRISGCACCGSVPCYALPETLCIEFGGDVAALGTVTVTLTTTATDHKIWTATTSVEVAEGCVATSVTLRVQWSLDPLTCTAIVRVNFNSSFDNLEWAEYDVVDGVFSGGSPPVDAGDCADDLLGGTVESIGPCAAPFAATSTTRAKTSTPRRLAPRRPCGCRKPATSSPSASSAS